MGIKTITDLLQKEERPSPKGNAWNRAVVRRILQREGLLTIKQWDRSNAVRDQNVVAKRIAELRSKKLSFKEIGAQLTRENLMPPIGASWHAQTVLNVWDTASTYDQQKAVEIAVGLHKANHSLRKIAQELTLRGLTPKRGGVWHSAQVQQLLLLAKLSA